MNAVKSDEMEKSNSSKIEQTEINQCASCGGNTVYDPASGTLKCPFCGNEQTLEKTYHNVVEHDFLQALEEKTHNWHDGERVFHCENCGAETILDQHRVADFCSFCGSSHITLSDHDAGIKPALVVPFKISKEEAVEKFKDWMKKRYFAPTKLLQSYTLNALSGAYIPYWTFDAHTNSSYVVRIGTYYYVTVTRTEMRDGKPVQVTEQVRKIRWRTETGTYREFFDDVLVRASQNVASDLIHKVEPFQLGELVDYQSAYLSGFLAERYSIPLKEGWNDATHIIDDRIQNGIYGQVFGDVVEIVNVSTDYKNITYKHILLPIWISSFHFNNKLYRFLVNGQTGKVTGQSPISIVKVSLLVVAIITIIAVVAFFSDIL